MSAVTSSSVTTKGIFVNSHFSTQVMILTMYFNGRRVKIKVRENLFCVISASFIGFVGHTFFRGDYISISSAFSSNQNPAYFLEISLNSRKYGSTSFTRR